MITQREPMMPRFFFAIISFFLLSCQIYGEIIETACFEEILKHADADSLILLDIDDTLLIPAQMLGTDIWFTKRLEQYQKQCADPSAALDKALGDWQAVRHLTDVKIVEEGTEKVIKLMQDRKWTVMGFTTQGLALTTRTIIQLNSLGINLSRTPPSDPDYYFINGSRGVIFRSGILFTSGSNKGDALVKFLNHISLRPKKIVFINDKASHLEDLEKGAASLNIPFIGLRYTYSDDRVANYQEEIAQIQWERSSFSHILSDEEARKVIHSSHK